jgi:hypothetical protein
MWPAIKRRAHYLIKTGITFAAQSASDVERENIAADE